MHSYVMTYLKESFKSMSKWKKYFRLDMLLGVLFIASLLSPTLSAITRISLLTYPAFFAVYLLWFISAILHYKKQGKKLTVDKSRFPEMIALLIWLAVVFIYTVIGYGENGYWGIIYTVMFMTVYMMDYIYSTYDDRESLKALIVAAFIILAFDSLRSCILLQSQPFAARAMNATYFKTAETFKRFFRLELLGLGDYPMFTAMAIGLPLLFYLTVKSKHKIFMSAIYILCLIGIFYSGYTGSTMLVYTMLLVYLIYALFFYKNKKHKKNMLLLILLSLIIIAVVILVLLPVDAQTQYFTKYIDLWMYVTGQHDLSGFVPKPTVEGNAADFATYGYRTQSRLNFYKVSFDTFWKNPVFGTGGYYRTETVANGIGNHSSWLDFLAMYGLVGCAPLILCFIFMFRRNLKNIVYSDTKFVRYVSWAFFMGYGLVNPVFVARCFPVIFGLAVAGDVRKGTNTLEFTTWIKPKSKRS